MFHIISFEFSPIRENTYILYNERKNCLIIDPGCYFPEEEDELDQYIRSHGLSPRMLLNTHCHLDHVFGNRFVSEKYGLEPNIHPEEKKLLEYAPTSGLMYNLPFNHYTGRLRFLEHGMSLELDDDKLEVILMPGHSPGSVGFYCREQSFIISGDVLFRHSIGRTDLPGGDLDTLLTSIRRELFSLPDHTVVYSGHGPATTVGEEKKSNPFLAG